MRTQRSTFSLFSLFSFTSLMSHEHSYVVSGDVLWWRWMCKETGPGRVPAGGVNGCDAGDMLRRRHLSVRPAFADTDITLSLHGPAPSSVRFGTA
jgi:hypothetical protein